MIYSWRRQQEIDAGQRPGLRTEEAAELAPANRELRRLRDENAILRRSNELLRDANAPWAAPSWPAFRSSLGQDS